MKCQTFAALTPILAFGLLVPARAADDVSMRAMKDELSRSISQLQLQKMDRPYFIAYRMDEVNQHVISATLGSLTMNQPMRTRFIGVEVRVGDYSLDNSNYFSLRTLGAGGAGIVNIRQAPLDDDYQQIRRDFWRATDAQYKKALEDLSAKRAALESRKKTDEIPDFSKEAPFSDLEVSSSEPIDDARMAAVARHLSAIFKTMPAIYRSSVQIDCRDTYTRYANSEGSVFTRPKSAIKIQITAETQAGDGQPLSDSLEAYADSISALPTEEKLAERTRTMAERLLKQRSASDVERYNGPVLFEGQAAGEVFLQQFAGGLMAVRAPLSDDSRFELFFNQMMTQLGGGASFADKIGGRVLPDFLNVTDNPLLSDFQGSRLLGASKVDDDGVKTRETRLVDHGVLKTLLATRVPVRSVPHSTGSRRGWGPAPTNLIISADKTLGQDELRKELVRRAQARGLDYGIVIRKVGGGGAANFMRMAARMAQQGGQVSNSLTEVYKLYADGHEELLKGIEIADLAPSAFRDIVAVGDQPIVFTDEFMPKIGSVFAMGISGESDMPVVSSVVPSMLFEELSLVKTQGPFPDLPISVSPLAKSGN